MDPTDRAEEPNLPTRLLERSRLVAPDDLPSLLAEGADELGATELKVWLVDYEQRQLRPLPKGAREAIDIDSTIAGRVFQTLESHQRDEGDGARLWLPLLDGAARLGVLEVALSRVDASVLAGCRELTGIAGQLLVAKSDYGDAVTVARRRQEMTLVAEMQWNLLPPLTFVTAHAVLSGLLEPSYRIAGDTFDYAVNGRKLHVAIIDAMGHGFEAMLLAFVAVSAYRHARRCLRSLGETFAEMDETIAERFGPDRFVTAQLVELDTLTGRLRWLNAGHPNPLLLRGGRVPRHLECDPSLPVGFGGAVAEVAEEQLEPGDGVLFFTDGVIEARAPNGEFFGTERLADLLVRSTTTGLPAPEVVRRLNLAVLDHQHGDLQDDATLLFVQWKGPEPVDGSAPGRPDIARATSTTTT